MVLAPVSPIDGLCSPSLFSLAPDPKVSLTPPLISRSVCEYWQWDMEMAEMSAVYLSHLSQSEAAPWPEPQSHSEGGGEDDSPPRNVEA